MLALCRAAGGADTARWSNRPSPRYASALAVRRAGCLDKLFADLFLVLLPGRLHRFAPLGALLVGQHQDFALARVDDALLGLLVQRLGLTVHLDGNLVDDRFQLATHLRGQTIPELRIGDQQVVADAVAGLGDVLLHLVVL